VPTAAAAFATGASRSYKTHALQTIIRSLRSITFHMPVMYGIRPGDLRRVSPRGCGWVFCLGRIPAAHRAPLAPAV